MGSWIQSGMDQEPTQAELKMSQSSELETLAEPLLQNWCSVGSESALDQETRRKTGVF